MKEKFLYASKLDFAIKLTIFTKNFLVCRMKSHLDQIQHVYSRTGKNMSCQMTHQA